MFLSRIPERRIVLARWVKAPVDRVRDLFIREAGEQSFPISPSNGALEIRPRNEVNHDFWGELRFEETRYGTTVRAVVCRPDGGPPNSWKGLFACLVVAAMLMTVDASPLWALGVAGVFVLAAEARHRAERAEFDSLNIFIRKAAAHAVELSDSIASEAQLAREGVTDAVVGRSMRRRQAS